MYWDWLTFTAQEEIPPLRLMNWLTKPVHALSNPRPRWQMIALIGLLYQFIQLLHPYRNIVDFLSIWCRSSGKGSCEKLLCQFKLYEGTKVPHPLSYREELAQSADFPIISPDRPAVTGFSDSAKLYWRALLGASFSITLSGLSEREEQFKIWSEIAVSESD